MNRMSIAALALFALPAVASDSPNFTPRQMAHCVMHRVKDAPSESYKTAIRACKSELDAATNDKGTQTAMNSAGSR